MHLTLSIALAASALASARPDPGVVIRNVAIVDVERRGLILDRDIVIRDGKIDSIVPAGQGAVAEGDTIINAAGLFAAPGLFDAHTHLIASAETYPTLLIAHGVTAARDLGGPTGLVVAIRDSFTKSEVLGPDLFITGAIVDGDPPVWPFSEPVTTPEAGRAAVHKLKDAGVDMIKVYSRLKKDVYEAVVDEAHKVGLKATGHIPESVTLDESIAAGHDCNEHLTRIDVAIAALAGHEQERNRELTRMSSGWAYFNEVPAEKLEEFSKSLARSGMVQCPTLIVMASIGRADKEETLKDPLMAYVPLHISEFWAGPGYRQWAPHAAKIVPPMQKTIAAFHKAGVIMMVGTDLANPFVFAGKAVHQEMVLWQDAGIPAADILRSATIIPAKFCGADDRLGSIAAGKTASIILTRKNPLDDIRNAEEIEHVLLRGRHFERAAIDKLTSDIRDSLVAAKPVEAPAVEKVVLPGVEVARGKYSFKWGDFAAGHEEFTINKTDDGYQIHTESRPQGGGQLPTSHTIHADATGRLTKVIWKQLSDTPLEATYTLTPDELKVAAARNGVAQDPQTVKLTPKDFLSLATYAADFLAIRHHALKPGETRELNALSFGYPDWRVQGAPYKITREPDTTIDRGADGAKVTCSHYKSEVKTPIGVFKTESWHDDQHLPYRIVVTMPFGVLSADRE